MPTAEGTLQGRGVNFIARFTIDEQEHMVIGSFSKALPEFFTAVQIKFDSTEQLTGFHAFTGQVGKAHVNLVFQNKPVISGTFATALEEGNTVTGFGTWGFSK